MYLSTDNTKFHGGKKPIAVLALLFLALALTSCDFISSMISPLELPTDDESDKNVEIRIQMPWISPALLEITEKLASTYNSETADEPVGRSLNPQSRAMFMTDKLVLELYDSSDQLVATVTTELSESNFYDSATASLTAAPGSGYYLIAYAYNTPTSESEPGLSGTSEPFDVVQDGRTPVHIRLLPVNPVVLDNGIPSAAVHISPTYLDINNNGAPAAIGGERWYSFVHQGPITELTFIPEFSPSPHALIFFNAAGEDYGGIYPFQESKYYGGEPLSYYLDDGFVVGEKYYLCAVNFMPVDGTTELAVDGSLSIRVSSLDIFTDGNDSETDALEIQLDSPVSVDIGRGDDIDYFFYESDGSTQLVLQLTGSGTNGGTIQYPGGGDDFFSLNQPVHIGSEVGTYRIEVENSYCGTAGVYVLSVSEYIPYSDDSDAAADSDANPDYQLSIGGGTHSGDFGAYDDSDWFVLETLGGENFSVSFSGPDTAIYYVYDEGMSRIDFKSFTASNPFFALDAPAGKYYFELMARGLSGSYEIAIDSFTPADDGNNDFASADPIAIDGGPLNSEISSFGEEDYFVFSAETGDDFIIEISSSGSMNYEVFDENQILIGWGGDWDPFFQADSPAGSFYIVVSPRGSELGSYELSVDSFTTAADGNGDYGSAESLLTDGSTVTSDLESLEDEDFFTFDAVAGESYRIVLENISVGGGIRLRLEDGSYFSVDSLYQYNLGSGVLQFTAFESEPYFLKVSAENQGTGNYAVSVENYIPLSDGNDSFAEAVLLTVGAGGNNYAFEESNDRDFYRIPVTADSSITIETSGTGGIDSDTYIIIYDQNEDYLGEDDDGGSGLYSRFVYTPPADGFVYVEVYELSGSVGDYAIVAY